MVLKLGQHGSQCGKRKEFECSSQRSHPSLSGSNQDTSSSGVDKLRKSSDVLKGLNHLNSSSPLSPEDQDQPDVSLISFAVASCLDEANVARFSESENNCGNSSEFMSHN